MFTKLLNCCLQQKGDTDATSSCYHHNNKNDSNMNELGDDCMDDDNDKNQSNLIHDCFQFAIQSHNNQNYYKAGQNETSSSSNAVSGSCKITTANTQQVMREQQQERNNNHHLSDTNKNTNSSLFTHLNTRTTNYNTTIHDNDSFANTDNIATLRTEESASTTRRIEKSPDESSDVVVVGIMNENINELIEKEYSHDETDSDHHKEENYVAVQYLLSHWEPPTLK